jgi:type IV secretion system protein VirB10
MNDDAKASGRDHDGGRLEPLPGELGIPNVAAPIRPAWSTKGMVAVALLVGSLIAVSAFSIQRFASGGSVPDEEARQPRNRPAAATTQARLIDMPAVPSPTSAPSPLAARIPAIEPQPGDPVEPIGVRRTGQVGPAAAGSGKPIPPEDAPILLVTTRPAASGHKAHARDDSTSVPALPDTGASHPLEQTRRNLESYQKQLQGVLSSLTQATSGQGGAADMPPTLPLQSGLTPPSGTPLSGGLFGGQIQGSATPRVAAGTLGNRSLTLPKGSAFTCALKTKVISATSGMVGCQVLRNVFSDDGRVLLIERGSHLDGEYRIAAVRPGTVRIPVLWTRLRTPQGVTVEIESPGTGPLGESGIDGYVDNRWGERIGAAMLLSLIDDSVKLVIQNQASDRQADTLVLPSTTSNTSKLAEKVLDSTISIPPLIYQNQGGIVGIYVARDVDFSSVYELQPTALPTPTEGK